MLQGQFCLAFLHSFQLLFHDCGYPRWSLFFTLPNAIFFYYLFSDFYYKAYGTNKKKEVKQSWSGGFCLGFDSMILSFTLNWYKSLWYDVLFLWCWMEKQHLALWHCPCSTQRQAQELISGPNLATEARLLFFNRTQSRVVIGLLTGHNTLRRHLHI